MISSVLLALGISTWSFGMTVGYNRMRPARIGLQKPEKQFLLRQARKRALSDLQKEVKRERASLKLLEHSCFKGESLSLQNEFYSSEYTRLPKRERVIRHMILGPMANEFTNNLFGVFPYHAYYRKNCLSILDKFGDYAQNRITSDAICLGILSANPGNSSLYINAVRIDNMNTSLQLAMTLTSMRNALEANDYPVMLNIYEDHEKNYEYPIINYDID
jgi:hypothetical protein